MRVTFSVGHKTVLEFLMTSMGHVRAAYRLPSDAVSAAAATLLYLAVTMVSTATIAVKFYTFISPIDLRLTEAFASTAVIICFLPLFLVARFSFGYLLGLPMYGMVAVFIVMSYSTTREYDHAMARLVMIAALLAFLVPALFLKVNIRLPALPPRAMDRALVALLALTVAILALDYSYGYRYGGFYAMQHMRNEIARPRLLEYINGMVLGAVLPFAFAYFAQRRRWVLAAIAGLLPLAFFPVLMSKMVFFAPAWGVFLLVLFTWFPPKVAAAVALLIPTSAGLLLFATSKTFGSAAIHLINLRMVGVPSVALDYYFEFFTRNPLTYFCQINVVRAVTGCPYAEQLGVLLQKRYDLGNFNASLFATEGIASLGFLAPIGTLVCGIVIAFANAAAARLSPVLIAVSSGVLIQTLMNVPLSTGLLTGGGCLLFILWIAAPRADLGPNPGVASSL